MSIGPFPCLGTGSLSCPPHSAAWGAAGLRDLPSRSRSQIQGRGRRGKRGGEKEAAKTSYRFLHVFPSYAFSASLLDLVGGPGQTSRTFCCLPRLAMRVDKARNKNSVPRSESHCRALTTASPLLLDMIFSNPDGMCGSSWERGSIAASTITYL